MKLGEIVGNKTVTSALEGMVSSRRIPHAIMLSEDDGGGAMQIALAFLQAVFGEENRISKLIHPDVHFVYPVSGGSCISFMPEFRQLVQGNPFFMEQDLFRSLGIEGKSTIIPVDEAKQISSVLSMSALEGGYRAVVIYLPEKMNETAANKLLKSIEEPPEKTQFVLITHQTDKVLQTISSRCQCLRVAPLSREEVAEVLVKREACSEEQAVDAAWSCGGSVGKALAHVSADGGNAEEMELFSSLMRALVGRDLVAALEVGEALSSLPSRENAKAFCKFASEELRKLFFIQQGLPQLAYANSSDKALLMDIAPRCKKSFPRLALPVLDRARRLIDRNINLKVLFTDMVNQLSALV